MGPGGTMWLALTLAACIFVPSPSPTDSTDAFPYAFECQDLCSAGDAQDWAADCEGAWDDVVDACETRCQAVLTDQSLACAACILDGSSGPYVQTDCPTTEEPTTGTDKAATTDPSTVDTGEPCDAVCFDTAIGSPTDCVKACTTPPG